MFEIFIWERHAIGRTGEIWPATFLRWTVAFRRVHTYLSMATNV